MCRARTALLAVAALIVQPTALAAAPDLSRLTLPPGFAIEIWTAGVPDARSLALGSGGTLFVGTRSAGRVYAITNEAGGQRRVRTLLSGLNMPNGIALRDGALYVAEVDRIRRYDQIEARLDRPPPAVEIARLPTEKHHGWRYLGFGPDGKLYVPIGAPCNVCDRDREHYATIVRMNADGSGREVVARGVRNSVGFTWHPQTGRLWFTDNGRDFMGDDLPACELNVLVRVGAHFGFPFCHQGDLADPEFGRLGRCADAVPPVQKLDPHVAPLGLRFYQGRQFPAEYRGRLLIAEHGSWNRSVPIGYRVMQVILQGERAVAYQPFVTGWLGPDRRVSGRPVDLQELPDGSVLISDDHAGVIYRVFYRGQST
ncbi:MAG: PQQ-dependent sugar dehydrogenase [Steroidobacteraceae bacterium]|nr:PQQ-dependent sugar dehydrogenase [Steroidobacteraceae bacterium]MDW8258770.1 PQQ-dependent sugar dehydrogenase [Gammaproteobacteria bacterium]